MDFELRRAREKLEKEQKERKEKARAKLERERKANAEAKKQREAIEAAQRSRRLDAAEAQLKADQQMEESVLTGRGIMFYRLLEAVPYQGIGDKIKLPPSCFTELSDQGALDKGPMYFQLSVVHQEGSSDMASTDMDNRRTTHSGVLEFTADEGSVALPPHLLRTDQHALSPLVLGKLEAGLVEEGNYIYYKFSIDNDTWGRIASGDARVEVRVEAETDGGDTDLYISRHPLIFPTRHQHEWSSHDIGSKALILSSRDNNLGAATYSVGVYGFKGRSKYQISVSIEDDFKRKLGQQAASSSSAMEIDTVECRNCKHYIPSRTIALHEAYCSRHNIVCQHAGCGIVLRVEEVKNHVHCNKCGQAFQHGEMEKHMKVFHEPLHCPCGVVLEKEQMVQHQASVCPLRLIACRFCGDMVQAGNSPVDARDRLRGLTEHESICGSRTAPCDSCGRAVMLKDMDIHQIAVHQKS
ncbi:TRAF-type zinc finger domain-containing protein 1 [Morella rubra]|uniref:TRAF-type zinc finger domain-containing protein 1 n=1 Tax=Morella rubra TaxID=262757 RepID=A0A6A1UL75_9ROSI|nr:TRAF-type zinc finger domain-containing protein 1 [Morella rubra]